MLKKLVSEARGGDKALHASTFRRFSFLAAAGAMLFSGYLPIARADAMTFQVKEHQIVSLANSPALLGLRAFVNEAGRLLLRLELEFANDCYGGVGPNIRLFEKPASAVLLVFQKVPVDGCPDIFQPVRNTIVASLPQNLLGQSLIVIARPAPETVVRTVEIGGATSELLRGGEIRALSASPRSVPIMQSVEIKSGGMNAYIVTGTLQIAPQCAGSDSRVELLEVPNAQGAPQNDVVLITSPARCTAVAGQAPTEISVRVDTPQPRTGRTVTLLNEASPKPIPLPD